MTDRDTEVLDASEMIPAQSGALEQMERAQVDIQIATAKRYPRSVTKFHHNAGALACMDETTARECFYRLPGRGGKAIEGPSVRMAEIVQSTWGNIKSGSRIVREEDNHIVAQGVCWDLENNVFTSTEVRRRITRKDGTRFGDDMIGVTSNAACSIALRNAIFKCVPRALVKPVLDKAKSVSLGEGLSFDEQRKKIFANLVKLGAKQAQILAALGRKGLADVDVDDLLTINGMITAIKDEGVSLNEALTPPGQSPPSGSKVAPSDIGNESEQAEIPA